MPKILLQGSADHHKLGCEFNRGGMAVVLCTVKAIKQFIPEAEPISFIQFSNSFSNKHGIKVVEAKLFSSRLFSLAESFKSLILFFRAGMWAGIKKYFHINTGGLLNHPTLREYHEADVIIDLSMDHYNDNLGIMPVIEHCRDLLLGRLLDTPVVVYAQTIGPFRGWLSSRVARFTLNRISLITVREDISQNILSRMKVNKTPVYLTADPAFQLEPASKEKVSKILSELGVRDNQILIGIGTHEGELLGRTQTWSGYKSALRTLYHVLEYCLPEGLFLQLRRLVLKSGYYASLQSQYSGKVMKSLAQIADHLVEKTGATVLLIPHTVYPEGYSEGERDGRVITEAVHQLVSNKEKVIPVNGDFTPQEIKGIIGQCDLLVTMKMHPCIAATSQSVPTIAIGPSHKYRGIMSMLGQEKWVGEWTSAEDVIKKVDAAWEQRTEIWKELQSKQTNLRESALLNAKLVKRLLDSKS